MIRESFKEVTPLLIIIMMIHLFLEVSVEAQEFTESDTLRISSGWADEAVTIGYITAPSALGLMFISALLSEWNAGYAGIPASAIILAAPPVIFTGGHSVSIAGNNAHSCAKLGWTLYALSIIPTSMALYGFTTDWGTTLPLTIASGILGSASIIAMSVHSFSRAEYARNMNNPDKSSWTIGIAPMKDGAMASITFHF